MSIQPDQNRTLSESRGVGSPTSASGRGAGYTSPPSAEQTEQPKATGVRGASLGLGLILASVLGAAAIYGVATREFGPPTETAAIEADQDEKRFSLAAADIDAAATEQLKAMLSSGATVAGELKSANAAGLAALPQTAPEVADDIKNGRRNVYRVQLLDFAAQDGDHIEFFADGVSYGDIDLKHGGKSLLIPLVPGKPTTFKILATTDGGGGVTVAFLSSLGEAKTAVLQVGQSETWQVTVQ